MGSDQSCPAALEGTAGEKRGAGGRAGQSRRLEPDYRTALRISSYRPCPIGPSGLDARGKVGRPLWDAPLELPHI